ncbi:unnamed protein product [Caenorhabditis brenneri]
MPQPWIEEVSQPERISITSVNKGALDPINIEDVLKFNTIDTSLYHKETQFRRKNLAVISSAKVEVDELNKFCEENTSVINHDNSSPSSDYGVDKDVRKALSDSRLAHNLTRVKVEILNAVQQKALQIILDGEGILVEAPTGIGKTYAFLIPAIEKALAVKRIRREKNIKTEKPSPTVLVIAPTGNLVRQLFSRCELALGLKDMDDVEPVRDIKIDMLVADYLFNTDECDIAFCTMGKLKATIQENKLCLDYLQTIVLDEADKMIDNLTFGLDVDWVLSHLKQEVMDNLQSCFFSATYQRDNCGSISLTPLQMRMLGEKPWKLVHCPKLTGYITQRVIKVENEGNGFCSPWISKMNVIRKLIDVDLNETECKKEGPYAETITIFCETVGRVAQVATALRLLGYNFKPVCRTLTKKQQEITLNELEFKEIQGIVCTNVMARGIDVSSVKHTIIMEMSSDFDTYKHRIGRVGRDGSGGKATVLIDSVQLMNGQFGNVLEALYCHMEEKELSDWMKEWYKRRNPHGYQ